MVQINREDMHPSVWLRSFKGCEDYTDKDADEIASCLDALASILLAHTSRSTHDITLNDKPTIKIAA